jgi:hypothetical protein
VASYGHKVKVTPLNPKPTNHGCSFTIAVQHFNFRLLDQIVVPSWLSIFIWAKFRQMPNAKCQNLGVYIYLYIIAGFYPNFQHVAKNIEQLLDFIFLIFKFSYHQIWLNSLMDDHQLSNITKLKRKNTARE